MNNEKLTQLAVVEAETRHADGLVFADDAPEVRTVTEFRASFRGHPVRVEFTDTPTDPASYRYNAWVFDAETNERITIGNGAATWEEALSIVHWQNLDIRWPN